MLGDSISTFQGISSPRHAEFFDLSNKLKSGVTKVIDTWWGNVIDKLGAKLLVNNSISGSTVVCTPYYMVKTYGCSDERTSSLERNEKIPQVIVVYLGSNDHGWGVPIHYEENCGYDHPESLGLFFVAYSQMLQNLKGNYPNAEIWCLTLPKIQNESLPNLLFRPLREDYNEAIRDACIEKGCRLIDISNCVYEAFDGLHPSVKGMQTIADAVIAELEKFED
ncbi:MAG: hypothetical protein IKJ07_07970 [Clostridia bacterium]|nr:hypothetical protein [Clostridia bacterium]